MIRRSRSVIVGSVLVIAGAIGCNSILDNTEGTLQQSQATPSVNDNQPAPSDTTDAGDSVPVLMPTPTPAPTTTAPTTTGCAAGTQECNGVCVSLDDPAYGCGNPACTPCSVAHGTPACSAGACTVKQCDQGYSDCNGKAADGCEVDLSKATSCGSCNAVCPAATPVCAPSGTTFQCGTGCTPSAPLLCGNECVSPLTSADHCGSCAMACPTPANGTATCSAGVCGASCNAGFNLCKGACTAATDPTACGPACTVCPVPANATATCAANACGFTCAANYGDCNANAADGCEAALLTDAHNCGKCGVDCGTGTCNNGACVAAPPPPADAGAPTGDAGTK